MLLDDRRRAPSRSRLHFDPQWPTSSPASIRPPAPRDGTVTITCRPLHRCSLERRQRRDLSAEAARGPVIARLPGALRKVHLGDVGELEVLIVAGALLAPEE